MNVVQLEDITFRRDGRMILSNVSWTIESGRHWVLLGANGSGKTTLLKIITGYEWPTSGTVSVLGKRYGACDLPKLRRAIGWVSSSIEHRLPNRDTALHIVASGLDASMGLYRTCTAGEIERARDALAAMGAEAVADQPYGLLSQGERQRTLIARALVSQPGLLVLDEPCIGLDPGARHEFLDDLARLADESNAPTMVFVTHHVDETGPWTHGVMILKEGRVLAAGPPAMVLSSRVLSEAFSKECVVEFDGRRYWQRM